MSATDFLFYVLAAMALVGGFLVVANPLSRNPVTSAMFLVLTLVAVSGLFLLLHAFFLAAVQILVYAGAVMVLFLFVIMLLDLREEERRRINALMLLAGLAVVAAIGVILVGAIGESTGSVVSVGVAEANAADLGRLLFTGYLLPFEILSVLLLVAMIGVVRLARRETRTK